MATRMLQDSKPAVTGRLPSLDGWRAVAITIILLCHAIYTTGFQEPSWWTTVFQGDLAVRMFFVLSGLLITHLLLAEADRHGRAPSLRAFYGRRVLRIFPVYFLYLAVVGLLAATGWYREAASSWIGSITFTRNLIGRGNSVTVHFWSLAIEEQFYLVWPAALAGLGLWRRPRLAFGVLLLPIVLCPLVRLNIVQAGWQNQWVIRGLGGFSIAYYADSLAIGCLGAFIYRGYRDRLRPHATGAVLIGAVVVLGVAAASDLRVGQTAQALIPLVEALATTCAIWVTIERRAGAAYWLLNTRPVVWLGTLSYSLYVWQQLFLSHFAGPRLSALPVYDWRIWWLAAAGCACLSYYLVERPILRIRDRLRASL